jgi:hypothetical protein
MERLAPKPLKEWQPPHHLSGWGLRFTIRTTLLVVFAVGMAGLAFGPRPPWLAKWRTPARYQPRNADLGVGKVRFSQAEHYVAWLGPDHAGLLDAQTGRDLPLIPAKAESGGGMGSGQVAEDEAGVPSSNGEDVRQKVTLVMADDEEVRGFQVEPAGPVREIHKTYLGYLKPLATNQDRILASAPDIERGENWIRRKKNLVALDPATLEMQIGRELKFQPDAAALDPDGHWIALAYGKRIEIWPWNVAADEPAWTGVVHQHPVDKLHFEPGGYLLSVANKEVALSRVAQDTGGLKTQSTVRALTTPEALRYLPDLQRLVLLGPDLLEIYDTARETVVLFTNVPSRGLAALAVSPDGSRLAVGLDNHTVMLRDVLSGRHLDTLSTGPRSHLPSADLTFSRDGQRLAVLDSYGAVTLWERQYDEAYQAFYFRVEFWVFWVLVLAVCWCFYNDIDQYGRGGKKLKEAL